MAEDERAGSAVVPVGGPVGDVAQEPGVPYRMLADGSGMLVSWRTYHDADPLSSWGSTLKGSASFAQQILTVAERAGASSAVHAGSTLFRLELPAGQTLQNLVPAIGGGFRG